MHLQEIRLPWRSALGLAVMSLVAGCGGGGGGGSGTAPSQPPVAVTPPAPSQPPVAVVPPAPVTPVTTFSVGGTVSGLGEGAVVTLAWGGDRLQVGANGSFAFAGRVDTGTAYSVTASAPAGYTCKVSDGAGSVAGADVSKIAVACAPVLLAGARSLLQLPLSAAVDSNGNQYVLDGGTHSLLKIGPSGTATVLTGRTGKPGYADGTPDSAQFYLAQGARVVADDLGNLFVSDNCNNVIRKIAADGSVGTLAGRQTWGCPTISANRDPLVDGTGKNANFNRLGPMTPDGAGGVIVAEMNNSATVRRVSASGVVTTQTWPLSPFNDGRLFAEQMARAPDGTLYFSDGSRIWKTANGQLVLVAGSLSGGAAVDATGAEARFVGIDGMTVASDGNLYVAQGFTVRKVTPDGVVTTIAGHVGQTGAADGAGTDARFEDLVAITSDGQGLVVLDTAQKSLRRVTLGGVVTTSATTPLTQGLRDGTGAAARMSTVASLGADAAGNLYFADNAQNLLRKVTAAGVVSTVAGMAGWPGEADGVLGGALLRWPSHTAAGRDGAIWVAQIRGVRRIQDGVVSTPDAGIYPNDVVADAQGNAIVSTSFPSGAVYRITPAGEKTLLVDTHMVEALINTTIAYFKPTALAIDANGHLLFVDRASAAVYKLGAQGELSVFAGTPMKEGHTDGPAGTATLGLYHAPDLAVDDKGNVYLSGQGSVRVISPAGVLSSPDFGWGAAWITAVAYANGKLYGATSHALLQTYLP